MGKHDMTTAKFTLSPVSNAALDTLPEAVARPGYDRAALSHGILHVGVGNFHRAHQAVYLDDLFAKGLGHDWAITGAGVRQGDAAMREALAAQDWMSTLVELSPCGRSARVVGAMIDFLPVAEDNAPLIAKMSDPATRIVSLTVTEGGYYLDGHGKFDPAHPDMVHDAANPGTPRSVFGAMIAALKARRAAGHVPFTVMCCDNIPGNGAVTCDTTAGLAAMSDPDLAAWLRKSVAFPDSMVDRITPATSPAERAMLERDFGVADAAPVFCEPFRQWVMEDHFPAGRPPLEEVGVTFTDDVAPFETLKLRILNGGHATIAYPGALLDHIHVHEAMADPLIRSFLTKSQRDEVLPILPTVPEMPPEPYLDQCVERFSNPDVRDTLRRLCHDGSNRQPKFIIPSIADSLEHGAMPTGLCLLSALWCRYCGGPTEKGAEIAPNDPQWDRLTAVAAEARTRPAVWLEMTDIYGPLAQNAALVARFGTLLDMIWAEGPRVVLTRYVAGELDGL